MDIHVFEGKCNYAQVYRVDPRWKKYIINFYPKDDVTRKAVKATGIKNSLKEDEDGFYYTFRRDPVDRFGNDNGAPKVVNANGEEITDPIGNGSTVEIAIGVESFESKQWGKVVRSSLEGVRVLKLIPYEKKEAAQAAPATTQAEAEKPKIPW